MEEATRIAQDGEEDDGGAASAPVAAPSFTRITKGKKNAIGYKRPSRWAAEGGVAAGAIDSTDAVALTRKVMLLLGRIGGDNRCVQQGMMPSPTTMHSADDRV